MKSVETERNRVHYFCTYKFQLGITSCMCLLNFDQIYLPPEMLIFIISSVIKSMGCYNILKGSKNKSAP